MTNEKWILGAANCVWNLYRYVLLVCCDTPAPLIYLQINRVTLMAPLKDANSRDKRQEGTSLYYSSD